MHYIDISPALSAQTAVFPGDTPFQRKIALSFEQHNNLLLSAVESTLHIGAHADASNHYHAEGQGIDAKDLRSYMGLCQVVEVKIPRGARILPKDFQDEIKAPRVLFRTGSFPNPDLWNGDFNSLSPELIDFLAAKNVQLVGIDTPSVDPADSKALETHNAIYKNNLSILEGLILDKANPGLYTLIALPLRIKNADASPVRAILLEKDVSLC